MKIKTTLLVLTLCIILRILYLISITANRGLKSNKELTQCNEAYVYHVNVILKQRDIIKSWENGAIRMQRNLGIKDIDSVFNYKNKIIYKDEMLRFK